MNVSGGYAEEDDAVSGMHVHHGMDARRGSQQLSTANAEVPFSAVQCRTVPTFFVTNGEPDALGDLLQSTTRKVFRSQSDEKGSRCYCSCSEEFLLGCLIVERDGVPLPFLCSGHWIRRWRGSRSRESACDKLQMAIDTEQPNFLPYTTTGLKCPQRSRKIQVFGGACEGYPS